MIGYKKNSCFENKKVVFDPTTTSLCKENQPLTIYNRATHLKNTLKNHH